MISEELEQSLARMSRDDLLALLERLVTLLRRREASPARRSLAGMLSGVVDPEFDLDRALAELRAEWSAEWKETP